MTWVIVILAVAAVLAIGAVLIERRRTGALRSRFGPEYDRVVDVRGDRRQAEAHLRGRIKARRALAVDDLSPAARERYVTQWRAVQASFVDEPRQALAAAVQLVDQVAAERGYRPADDADDDDAPDTMDMVAVDHAHEAADVRAARTTLAGRDDASIDDLRSAFIGCRGLFDALVGSDATARIRVGRES
ncbi:MAG TPA: hypothetical protein VKB57_11285 [Acidimicrobiales bacterium]|nr:hypothetical protein [Acidimicrobiales bacterium]